MRQQGEVEPEVPEGMSSEQQARAEHIPALHRLSQAPVRAAAILPAHTHMSTSDTGHRHAGNESGGLDVSILGISVVDRCWT